MPDIIYFYDKVREQTLKGFIKFCKFYFMQEKTFSHLLTKPLLSQIHINLAQGPNELEILIISNLPNLLPVVIFLPPDLLKYSLLGHSRTQRFAILYNI